MKRFGSLLIAAVILLAGCGQLQETAVALSPQDLKSCSYQSAIYAIDEAGFDNDEVFADASANCIVERDGDDQIKMFVRLQTINQQGNWVTLGTIGESAKKTLPSGVTQGTISFSHIKSYNYCHDSYSGLWRPLVTIREYRNGTDTVTETTTYIGPQKYVLSNSRGVCE